MKKQISDFEIIEGRKEDLLQLLDLIRDLAAFEKAPEKVTNSIESMEVDGFGPHKVFDFFLARKEEEVLGMAVTYFRYSTWRGKALYLEDIYIKPEFRGLGLGRSFFSFLAKKCLEWNCRHMVWQVLDWNQEAIDFYKGLGSEIDSEWENCYLDLEQIKRLASNA